MKLLVDIIRAYLYYIGIPSEKRYILKGAAMKLTTNFIVYLNAENKVHCAKCRVTGRFVKRSIAQNEYTLEYTYKVTFKSFIAFMFTVFYVLLSIKQAKKLQNKIIVLNVELKKALQQNDFKLITKLQSELFSAKNTLI